jgi:hypothetical protein
MGSYNLNLLALTCDCADAKRAEGIDQVRRHVHCAKSIVPPGIMKTFGVANVAGLELGTCKCSGRARLREPRFDSLRGDTERLLHTCIRLGLRHHTVNDIKVGVAIITGSL